MSESATPLSRSWGQGLLIIAALLALLAGWEFANDHVAGFVDLFRGSTRQRATLFVILLTGFIWGARKHSIDAFRPDLERIGPMLQATRAERQEILSRFTPTLGVTSASCSLAGMTIGVLVVGDGTGTPYLLSDQPWRHDVTAGLLFNTILFAILGDAAYRSILTSRLTKALIRRTPPVDLLDLSFFAPFAQQGLRLAVLWLGGSSIASLIYFDQDHDIRTAMVIGATVTLGIYSLLQPLRGAHAAIVAAKRDELARIREAIRVCRSELLDPAGGDSTQAAARTAGLLAYETRIEAVHDWPLDPSTVVRFLALVTLAIGSWLGGAIVELLLDQFVAR